MSALRCERRGSFVHLIPLQAETFALQMGQPLVGRLHSDIEEEEAPEEEEARPKNGASQVKAPSPLTHVLPFNLSKT